MLDFAFHFSHPWLLLLLIPAFLLTLIPHFLVAKKYRRTRNRIVSMVLHLVVVTLSVLVLSGVTLNYSVANDGNEILILVDVSDTEGQSKEKVDEFLQNVIFKARQDKYKVGIVTFGYDQKYAVPLTNNLENVYNDYRAAELPDTSATDIASALNYAKDLFTEPKTAKIVLITDGKETDGNAQSVVKAVSASGIRVDVVNIASSFAGNDVQIVSVETPSYHVNVDETSTINVTVKNKGAYSAELELYDNGVADEEAKVRLEATAGGSQTVGLNHVFQTGGVHELALKLQVSGEDVIGENNTYYTYISLNVFNNILIVERTAGESDALEELLGAEEYEYETTVLNLADPENGLPTEQEEITNYLRQYDQVIMNNIANADMVTPERGEAFVKALEVYVSEYGGGMFTVGGAENPNAVGEEKVAHAYNRKDMYGTLYQQMLPVQAINYTPPVGVVIVMDVSGSMTEVDVASGKTSLQWAVQGAQSCITALSERDYIGVITFSDYYDTVLELTRRTEEEKIRTAIDSIQETKGATIVPGAIERAGQQLRALKSVDKRHIILITDGEIEKSQESAYLSTLANYYQNDGITLSVVGIGMTGGSEYAAQMLRAINVCKPADSEVDLSHRLHMVNRGNMSALVDEMKADLSASDIKEVNYETFNPGIADTFSPLVNGVERLGSEGADYNHIKAQLNGFYGVKLYPGAKLVLSGMYDVPVYAQRKYGNGTVGSFMCDLQNSDWSGDFMSSEGGRRFIVNAINNLMPAEDIRPSELTLELNDSNYTNRLNVYSTVGEGERLEGRIVRMSAGQDMETVSFNESAAADTTIDSFCTVKTALSAGNDYSRVEFTLKESGLYRICVEKYDANGNVVATKEIYKEFSYSAEYDNFAPLTNDELDERLETIASLGNGKKISDLKSPSEIFEGFLTRLERTYDPRILFMILAIALFLLDVVVRKFKFKWIHEIVREYKEKKHEKA